MLVACNKSEKITAHFVEFIKKRLEKEIEALRQTTGTLADTSGAAAAAAVGKPVEFKFEHLARNVGVDVAATIRRRGKPRRGSRVFGAMSERATRAFSNYPPLDRAARALLYHFRK